MPELYTNEEYDRQESETESEEKNQTPTSEEFTDGESYEIMKMNPENENEVLRIDNDHEDEEEETSAGPEEPGDLTEIATLRTSADEREKKNAQEKTLTELEERSEQEKTTIAIVVVGKSKEDTKQENKPIRASEKTETREKDPDPKEISQSAQETSEINEGRWGELTMSQEWKIVKDKCVGTEDGGQYVDNEPCQKENMLHSQNPKNEEEENQENLHYLKTHEFASDHNMEGSNQTKHKAEIEEEEATYCQEESINSDWDNHMKDIADVGEKPTTIDNDETKNEHVETQNY